MIEVVGVVKLVTAGACLAGAWRTWKQLPETEIRSKMRKCFHAADLYLSVKRKKGEQRTYPTVNRVSIYRDRMQVIFSVPLGINPQDVHKSEWCFRQTFGNHITLDGDAKAFSLTVYPAPIEQFPYNFDELQGKVDGHMLPIVAGKSRSGIVVYDMVEHPHLLIAGETGSGKSTQLRSLLTFLIQHMEPDKFELYTCDLKRSEFHIFKGIAKESAITVIDTLKIVKRIQKEMKARGDLLNQYGEAHVTDLPKDAQPPFILLAIDEVALLKKETAVMEIIEEVSSIGRALGVFLILSMQRPDHEVLDGKLKQNLTVRMAFRHADGINSRITIGTDGAEEIKLSEKGLMLLKMDRLERVQSPYLELKKAKEILSQYKKVDTSEGVVDIDGWEVMTDDAKGQIDLIEP